MHILHARIAYALLQSNKHKKKKENKKIKQKKKKNVAGSKVN